MLAKILCNQATGLSSTELLELRIQVTELQVVLWHKRERAKRGRVRRRSPADVVVKEESPPPDPFPPLMQKTQCPPCIGDGGMSYEERTFKYYRPAVMNDHFDREHVKDGGHLDHFRSHVPGGVHGIRLRPKRSG